MASHSTSHLDKGFTLLETLVVMGIFIVLMGVGGVIAFNSYKGYLFRSERSTAVSVLERARSRAMANYNSKKHGACYNSVTHKYELFEGTVCQLGAADNEKIEGNPNAVISDFGVVIFDQLSGNFIPTGSISHNGCTGDEKSISIKESDKESFICINNAGRINW